MSNHRFKDAYSAKIKKSQKRLSPLCKITSTSRRLHSSWSSHWSCIGVTVRFDLLVNTKCKKLLRIISLSGGRSYWLTLFSISMLLLLLLLVWISTFVSGSRLVPRIKFL